MESFSSRVTLPPRCVFHCCWATCSAHRAPLFPLRGDTKATFEARTAKRRQWNTRHNKRSCCVCVRLCVCGEWPDRETRHWPPCDGGPGGQRQGSPAVPNWRPQCLHFYTPALYALAVKFNPLKRESLVINFSLTCPQGQTNGQTKANAHNVSHTFLNCAFLLSLRVQTRTHSAQTQLL